MGNEYFPLCHQIIYNTLHFWILFDYWSIFSYKSETSYWILLSKGLSKKFPKTNLLISLYFNSNIEQKTGQKRGEEFSMVFNKFLLYTIIFIQQCFYYMYT